MLAAGAGRRVAPKALRFSLARSEHASVAGTPSHSICSTTDLLHALRDLAEPRGTVWLPPNTCNCPKKQLALRREIILSNLVDASLAPALLRVCYSAALPSASATWSRADLFRAKVGLCSACMSAHCQHINSNRLSDSARTFLASSNCHPVLLAQKNANITRARPPGPVLFICSDWPFVRHSANFAPQEVSEAASTALCKA